MSIIDLDLNIDNYELHEVESFMRLVSPYTLNDVIENEKMIVSIVSQDVTCPIEKKSEFVEFMKNVKYRLVQNLKRQLDKTIQNDQLLPEEEYVIDVDVPIGDWNNTESCFEPKFSIDMSDFVQI